MPARRIKRLRTPNTALATRATVTSKSESLSLNKVKHQSMEAKWQKVMTNLSCPAYQASTKHAAKTKDVNSPAAADTHKIAVFLMMRCIAHTWVQ